MATVDRQVFVAVLVLFAFIEFATSLECYVCSSGPDDVCDDPFSYHAHKTVHRMPCGNSPHLSIPGAGPNTHCGKTKKSADNKIYSFNENTDYVVRKCVPENYCRLVKDEVSECELCETDLCNSASLLIPSCVLGIASLLLVRFY